MPEFPRFSHGFERSSKYCGKITTNRTPRLATFSNQAVFEMLDRLPLEGFLPRPTLSPLSRPLIDA
jgi:hypothetical protein